MHITVNHARAKQRSDKKTTSFIIPRKPVNGINFASYVDEYLNAIKSQQSKVAGRVFWRGTKDSFMNQAMGKNMLGKIPHEMAAYLNLDKPEGYTFHSYRRSSATKAADEGATPQQLVDHYGWASAKLAQEYISTSKPARRDMASKLAASNSKPVPNSNMEVSSVEQEGNAPAMDHQADEIEGSPSSGREHVTAPILKMEQGNLGHILQFWRIIK